jgi:hypothetical protein
MSGAAKERKERNRKSCGRHDGGRSEVMRSSFLSVAPVLVGRRGEGHIAPWRADAIRRSVAAAARSVACEREFGAGTADDQ